MQKNEPKTEVNMSRLTPMQTNGAGSELKPSLKSSRLKLDEAPRFLQVLANSPASLRAYLRADAALVRGQLTPHQRQQVALAVAETEVDFPLLQPSVDAPRVGTAQSKVRPATRRTRSPRLNMTVAARTVGGRRDGPKTRPPTRNENKNANNIIAKQKVHWQSDS